MMIVMIASVTPQFADAAYPPRSSSAGAVRPEGSTGTEVVEAQDYWSKRE
jgi:hypothetical protein